MRVNDPRRVYVVTVEEVCPEWKAGDAVREICARLSGERFHVHGVVTPRDLSEVLGDPRDVLPKDFPTPDPSPSSGPRAPLLSRDYRVDSVYVTQGWCALNVTWEVVPGPAALETLRRVVLDGLPPPDVRPGSGLRVTVELLP